VIIKYYNIYNKNNKNNLLEKEKSKIKILNYKDNYNNYSQEKFSFLQDDLDSFFKLKHDIINKSENIEVNY
jgi:hypothetical protein